ncbi:MAG: 4-hydroxymandelate oxidase, partial [Actinomycetota bacterium]|nr:4-hydroxymandelate oxidase [Actinomycetota bacterium]
AAEPFAWEYLARGSGDGTTLRENVAAWRRWTLLPHVLRDVSAVDLSTRVLGTTVTTPILVAPTAMHRFFTDDGELATARAAADVGTVYVVSMAATTSVEDVAAAAPDGLRWAQMYMLRDRGRTRALAERANAAGYRAIVASVDGASVGRGIASASAGRLSPPEWVRYPNLASPADADSSDIMRMVSDFDPSVSFDDLASFGEWSGLPVVVKGLLRADDAVRAVDAGAAAIAVSNHGGRVLDGVAATADVLPAVVDAVGGRAEVYVDGGIRSGTDVVKALALGARAVMVGRPVLWGLVVGGRSGAAAVLGILATQFESAMACCGVPRVDELTRDLVALAR